jgi:hypothetical protein
VRSNAHIVGPSPSATGTSGCSTYLLLGLLDPRRNVAVEPLRHLGANPEVVRTRVLADLGKAA